MHADYASKATDRRQCPAELSCVVELVYVDFLGLGDA